MPLPDLNWRFVGSQSFTAGSISAAHDALYTLGTALVYANGSVRTPGTGSAWTWNRDQPAGTTLAVYGVPPTNALTMKYILGGVAGSTGYTTASPDTALANTIVLGMGQNAGAYVSPWPAAAPFTSGFFSNYWRATRAFSVVAYNTVFLWESQEACIVQWAVSGTGLAATASFGALFDPRVYVSGLTCQSDNRLYFMSTSGGLAVNQSNWLSTPESDGNVIAGGGSLTANTNHTGYILPDGSALSGPYVGRNITVTGSAGLLTVGGDAVVVPFNVAVYIAGGTPWAYIGASRNFGIAKDTISGTVWSDAGTDLGYVVGYSTVTAGDCIVLKV